MKDKDGRMFLMESNGRKEYIDLMKGVAMILVIATHILPFSEQTNSVLSSLHNSTFYFASGILFFPTGNMLKEGKLSIKDILIKKLYRIVYPCLVWVFLYSLLEICLQYVLNDTMVAVFYIALNAINRLWFLPVLFVAFIFNSVLWRFDVNEKLVIAVWIVSIFVSALFSSAISKVLFFSFLVWLGTLCANVYITGKMSVFFLGLYIVACYFAFFSRGYISEEDAIRAGYKLFILYMIATIGALMMWSIAWEVCRYVNAKSISFFTDMGKNSIYFYIMHYFSIYFFEHIPIQSALVKICCFLMALLIPLLYIKFVKCTAINKYLFCIK